jgi:2-C-methyl-D-erythritol 2,4-cyclodiphosphate synthase
VKINVIIAAAGGSSRAKTAENKIFVKSAKGKPVIYYSVGIFFGIPDVKKIIVAAKPSETKKIIEILKDISKNGKITVCGGKETRSKNVEKPEISKNIPHREEEFHADCSPAPTFPSVEICEGGATRSESIKNALNRVDKDCEIVLIHDAARPYVSRRLVDRVIADTEKFGSSVPFLPVADTLKYFNSDLDFHFDIKKENGLLGQVDDNPKFFNIEKNNAAAPVAVDRKNYFTVSTPQGFFADEIVRAYSKIDAENDGFTDDSSVYEKYIAPVRLTEGQPSNLKITTEQDVEEFKNRFMQKNRTAKEIHPNFQAQDVDCTPNESGQIGSILNDYSNLRIGNGYDIHRLISGRPLILGGVKIPHPLGLDGHSDADALVHSVIDALLSAVGSRDIGVLFPDDDPAYKDIDSMVLLEKTYEILRKKSASIINISSVIVAEAPKLSPYVESMKISIAAALKISPSRISISCKTNERLGEIGEGKAVAVHSVCLINIDEI